MAGLLPPYPITILYVNSNGLQDFCIKVNNLNYSIILSTCTAEAGRINFFSTSIEGSPITIKINEIKNELVNFIPYSKDGDKSLYFLCKGNGITGRAFRIFIFPTGGYKNEISYEITDADELSPVE